VADLVAIGLGTLAVAAALQAAGVPIFVALFGDGLDRSIAAVRTMALRTALVGLVLTAGHAVVEPARLTGTMSGALDGSLHALLLGSDFGTTLSIRLLGLGIIVGGLLGPRRIGEAAGMIGASLIVASFAFMGHTAADDQRWLLAPLLLLHLLAVAFWLGALWPLRAITRLEGPAVGGALVERFSRVAVWLVPVIFLAGVAMAAALVPGLASLGTPYGLSLLAKVAGFAVLMALAAANKWRLGPGVARGDRAALRRFRRSVLAEWILILVVVAVTVTMTSLFSPDH